MEEIVARKKKSVIVGYFFVAAVALLILIVGIVCYAKLREIGALALCLFVGLILLGTAVWLIVCYFKQPENIVVYKDGLLYLCDGTQCSPAEVTKCHITVTRRNGIVSKYGTLRITVNGEVHKFKNVDRIQKAQSRIAELNRMALCEAAARNAAEKTGNS